MNESANYINEFVPNRTASVQAISDVILWVLDRSEFKMITMQLGMGFW